ncbi:MAG: twin transmembrane helix small protein [Alphaproteobacteria bacterium]|jgi:hypothetical protein|nr:twin transmembrane helix small protein [Alphaproteobacteria bacterium]
MDELLSYLLGFALVAIAGVLLFGVINMARGGASASLRSNKLMRWRVGLQFAALAIIVLFMVLSQGRS